MKAVLRELHAILINYRTTIVGLMLIALAGYGSKVGWFNNEIAYVIVVSAVGFFGTADIKRVKNKDNEQGK